MCPGRNTMFLVPNSVSVNTTSEAPVFHVLSWFRLVIDLFSTMRLFNSIPFARYSDRGRSLMAVILNWQVKVKSWSSGDVPSPELLRSNVNLNSILRNVTPAVKLIVWLSPTNVLPSSVLVPVPVWTYSQLPPSIRYRTSIWWLVAPTAPRLSVLHTKIGRAHV